MGGAPVPPSRGMMRGSTLGQLVTLGPATGCGVQAVSGYQRFPQRDTRSPDSAVLEKGSFS